MATGERRHADNADIENDIEIGRTSFANPAVTLARAATAAFPASSHKAFQFFVGRQIAGAVAAMFFGPWISRAGSTPKKLGVPRREPICMAVRSC
jgi:hypothetical protein